MNRALAHLTVAAAAAAATAAVTRQPWLHLGATREERSASLPGDEILPHPMVEATRATRIAAPADRVWPWLAQMGHGRAGWYGYDLWDNAGVPSSSQLLPDVQELSVGDVIADAMGPFGFTVVRLDPGAAIVFRSTIHPVTGKRADPIARPEAPFLDFTWAFVLRPDGPDASRLIVRMRYVRSPQVWVARSVEAYELVDAVFTRKMLREIRARAEGAHGSTVADRSGSAGGAGSSASDRLRSRWAAVAGQARRDPSAA